MRAVGDGCRVYIAARASSRDVDELGVDVDDVVAAAVEIPIRGAGDVHDGDEDEDGGPGPGGVSHGAGDGDGDDLERLEHGGLADGEHGVVALRGGEDLVDADRAEGELVRRGREGRGGAGEEGVEGLGGGLVGGVRSGA